MAENNESEHIVRNEKELTDIFSYCKKILPKCGKIKIILTRGRTQRSSEQNRYYWKVIVQTIVEYYQKNNREFIFDLLDPEFTAEFIHEYLKKKYNRNRSTADLDTDGFQKYFDKIREDWFHKRGIHIPAPNEPPL